MQDETDRDELVMTLVASAAGLSDESRERYLDESCSDPEIRAEVEERIEWEHRMGGFLSDPVIDALDFETGPFAPGEYVTYRFRIVNEVGHGGMGVVYEAFDEKLERRVALKCAQPGYGHRLPPEARAAREVSHFNVCKVHELHSAPTEVGEIEFLSMEFIDGESLSERLRRAGAVPPREAREIALQICAGLSQAHRQGVIHGDLKCGNILLTQSPEGGTRAVVTDFGLATLKPAAGSALQSGRHGGGTADYMAPELFAGARANVASDIYALGVIFHEMLTGKRPERVQAQPGLSSQASTVTVQQPLPGPNEVRRCAPLPAPWGAVVGRCLEAAPEDRFSSVDELTHRLSRGNAVRRWSLAGMAAATVAAAVLWVARPAPSPPVRLAVLPVTVEGDPLQTAAGLAVEVAERLKGARRGFVVIPPADAKRNRVDTPEKARTVFGATHALRSRLRNTGGQIAVMASVVDTGSGRPVEELNGSYSTRDPLLISKALAAMVTRAFHLRTRISMEVVAAAAYPFYVQGINLLRGEQVSAERAIPFFEKAIELDPRSALPYAGLAEAEVMRFKQGHNREWLERAEGSIAKAQSLNADSVPVLMAAGVVKEQYGWYERAAQDYERALELASNNSEAWNRLAGAYSNMNRLDDAIATYQKAIQAQPDYYAAYLELGLFYYRHAQFPEAETYFRRTTVIAPGFGRGYMDLGLAVKEEGRFQEAEQFLLKSLGLQETFAVLINLGYLCYQEERYQEAAGYFQRSVDAQQEATGYEDLGDALRHLGRLQAEMAAYRTARDLAEAQVAQNPRDAFARAQLARMSALLGAQDRAEFEITQALAMNPGVTMVMREAAFTFEAMKEREKTLQVLATAPWRLLDELSHQPDMGDLQRDPRFQEMLRNKAAQQQ